MRNLENCWIDMEEFDITIFLIERNNKEKFEILYIKYFIVFFKSIIHLFYA